MKLTHRALLVVEDNDDDFFILQRCLDKANLPTPVRRTSDGQEAIYYVSGVGSYADRIAHPAPCLVLLDLKLPLRHGFEVLQWVRASADFKTLPVLVLTSSREPRDIRQAYELGANAFLTKPTSVDALAEIAESIRTFWLMQNLIDPALLAP